MEFKHHYNAIPTEGEKNFGPSKTVPDQSLSVGEIMRRHARGLPITGERVPIYEGEDNDLPDLSRLDLAEREQIIRDSRSELDEINDRIKANEQKAKETAKNSQRNESIEEAEVIEEKPTKKDQKPIS